MILISRLTGIPKLHQYLLMLGTNKPIEEAATTRNNTNLFQINMSFFQNKHTVMENIAAEIWITKPNQMKTDPCDPNV